MTDLQERDNLDRTGTIGRETPYFGPGAGAGFSTIRPPDTGSQQPSCPATGTILPTAADPLAQGADVGLDDDEEVPRSATKEPRPGYQPPTLLTIPLEIRLEIYGYLLTAPSIPLMPSRPSLPASPSLRPANAPSPSTPQHPPDLPAAPRRGDAGARVAVRLDAEPRFSRADAAAQLTGMAEVVVDAWQAEWRDAGAGALRLLEGVRGVRAARVTGSTGGFEAYARWLERAMMADIGDYVRPFAWGDE
ncbi:hypothetical protein F4802DRAFT_619752 [Xylaria palmicola]|nr:hypothetical protein F4802DRAFT_619752 [Xylaria palmicola]